MELVQNKEKYLKNGIVFHPIPKIAQNHIKYFQTFLNIEGCLLSEEIIKWQLRYYVVKIARWECQRGWIRNMEGSLRKHLGASGEVGLGYFSCG